MHCTGQSLEPRTFKLGVWNVELSATRTFSFTVILERSKTLTLLRTGRIPMSFCQNGPFSCRKAFDLYTSRLFVAARLGRLPCNHPVILERPKGVIESVFSSGPGPYRSRSSLQDDSRAFSPDVILERSKTSIES